MPDNPTRRGGLAQWYETAASPLRILIILIILIYAWTLPWGFVIDDCRHLRLMREYHEGKRPALELYRFLRGNGDNCALRASGHYPWWVTDDVRYQHFRPLSERFLYGEFLLFGEWPLGYRAVSLALYVVGVALVLRLFRELNSDERLARWAALFFAVAACHAAPVLFISMQADLLGLLLVSGALLVMIRYMKGAGPAHLAGSAVLYALALGTKESSLPVAIAPVLFGVFFRQAPRRSFIGFAALAAIGVLWLSFYVTECYGSNSATMLDPVHTPLHYLSELPERAMVLLSTWLIPISPFFFYLRPFGRPWVLGLAVVGAVTMLCAVWLMRRSGRRAAAMTLWAIVFLPLLACSVPDDRNMLLPGIGLSMLGAMWATLPVWTGRPGVRKLPLFLFFFSQIPAVAGAAWAMRFMETQPREVLEQARDAFGRPLKNGDHIFFLNACYDWQLLFGQDRFELLPATQGARVSFLCDVRECSVARIDDYALRIEGGQEPLITGFLGAMGQTRAHQRREGDLYDAGEFKARIVKMADGRVLAVEFRFLKPLESEAYRFYWCRLGRSPVPVKWAEFIAGALPCHIDAGT